MSEHLEENTLMLMQLLGVDLPCPALKRSTHKTVRYMKRKKERQTYERQGEGDRVMNRAPDGYTCEDRF